MTETDAQIANAEARFQPWLRSVHDAGDCYQAAEAITKDASGTLADIAAQIDDEKIRAEWLRKAAMAVGPAITRMRCALLLKASCEAHQAEADLTAALSKLTRQLRKSGRSPDPKLLRVTADHMRDVAANRISVPCARDRYMPRLLALCEQHLRLYARPSGRDAMDEGVTSAVTALHRQRGGR